jgi:hypothetical protein
LIGVCLAITSILVCLLIASSGLRRWLCKPVNRKLNPYSTQHTYFKLTLFFSQDCAIQLRRRRLRRQEDARRRQDDVRRQEDDAERQANDDRRRLEEDYTEYLNFREFRAMRGSEQWQSNLTGNGSRLASGITASSSP